MTALLEIETLSVDFPTSRGVIRAVERLSFSLEAGETVALVGESGSGKTTAALALLGLLAPGARIAGGRIMFERSDLLTLSPPALRKIRGGRIGMIFQDPMMALNPVFTVGWQIAETLRLHRGLSVRAARERSIELLHHVGVPAAEQRVGQYPHELSGGMRQRVIIAMAIACEPSLLIADEPATALDVTVQAQVLDLINRLKRDTGTAVLLITHDLAVVWENAQRVIVMYAGRKVEDGPVDSIFARPAHPYTQGLLRAASWAETADGALAEIPGTVPSPRDMPSGCRFAPRCAHAVDLCRAADPPLSAVSVGHAAACVLAREMQP
jgi:oligopeptide/dipeptide ABC transporter ATP-binding protein